MPTFSGQVRHQNSNLPIVDLSDGSGQFNQGGRSPVKGMGLFTNTSSRSSVTSGLRTKGYMAIVGSTPYLYNSSALDDSTWGAESNWTSLGGSHGIPSGGGLDDLLAKSSTDDYDASWVNSVVVESGKFKKHGASASSSPTLTFSRQKTSETLSNGDSLGEINSVGFNSGGVEKVASSIRFVADGTVDVGIGSRVEFWTSTSENSSSNASEKAVTIDSDKKLIFAGSSNSNIPTVVEGGMYYNTTNKAFFVGV